MYIRPAEEPHGPGNLPHHPARHPPFDPSRPLPGVRFSGTECYIDMGKFYNTGNLSWWPQPPNWDIDTLLDPSKGLIGKLIAHAKESHITTFYLSFGQLSDISRMLRDSGHPQPTPAHDDYTGGYADNHNSFQSIYWTAPGDEPQPPTYPNWGPYLCNTGPHAGQDFVQILNSSIHQAGMKTSLAFGGGNDSKDHMKLPGSGAQSAKELLAYLKQNGQTDCGFDAVDFDIEGPTLFEANSTGELNIFFSDLHKGLNQENKTCTLTIEGQAVTNPAWKLLIQNFDQYFDGVNLMLYDIGTTYYLNPSAVEGYLAAFNVPDKNNPDKIHIGFFPNVNYKNPSSCSPPYPYKIDPSWSNGQTAAEIYKQLSEKLHQDGYLKEGQSLGTPFVWTENPDTDADNAFMRDFYNALKGISPNFWS